VLRIFLVVLAVAYRKPLRGIIVSFKFVAELYRLLQHRFKSGQVLHGPVSDGIGIAIIAARDDGGRHFNEDRR
jgi:hypothetical protein